MTNAQTKFDRMALDAAIAEVKVSRREGGIRIGGASNKWQGNRPGASVTN